MIEININPIAFLNVRWYGILVALGIAVIVLWLVWQVRKGARVSYDTVLMAAIVGIPSGVIVSRLLHVLDLWDYYSCLLYTSPSPRDRQKSRMPSSA